MPRYADVEAGTEIAARDLPIRRADLVRYAGASGDFNVIHWNERVAREVGLPNVIAHGMLTMAKAANLLVEWAGDPGRVEEYGVRFAKPVVVPDDDEGATVTVTAKIAKKLEDNRVRVDIEARSDGEKVLSLARAVVRLD
ncbi:MaoC family dehydratase [Cumulibacter manganitolerans]|uniref:MaoC family dehydratase n=1 Tax=Cumulibacter manganitolerans TaxID=1884992 RepID=UPI001296B851|nr:MaoC family dehydratase [Cumulibacter manganitolerans]